MSISFLGVLFILRPDYGIFAWVGVVGLIAALGQAGSQVLFGMQSRTEKIETTLFYVFFLSSVVSLLLFFIVAPLQRGLGFEISSLVNSRQEFYWYLLALGLVSVFSQFARGAAYRCARPGTLAPILYVTVIISGLLDWAVFDHLPDRWVSIGAILVVLGGLISFIQRKATERKYSA